LDGVAPLADEAAMNRQAATRSVGRVVSNKRDSAVLI